MKQPIRYFATGLLTASLVLLIVVSFFDEKDAGVTNLPIDEMTEVLKKEGYHVLSSAEYITLSMSKDQEITEEKDVKPEKEPDPQPDEKKKEKEKEKEKDKKEPEKPKVNKYTLTIKENMLAPTIGELLKKNKIIDDVQAFSQYFEKEGYAPYIQLGDHELSSDMSNFEIAEKIAKKR